jgi:hypothetical protein
MNKADNFALVRRPPGALEKAEPGAKRILTLMVADTLALVKKEQFAPAPAESRSDHAACLRELCRAFREQCPPATVHPLPPRFEDISLACLLLTVEFGGDSPKATSVELTACLDKVAGRFWFNTLPWRLALEFCGEEPDGASGLDELVANFDHHSSSLRIWMFEIAWCVRDTLDPLAASKRLLKVVADELGYWPEALGLCHALCPTEDNFEAMADRFHPGDLKYRQRIDSAKQQGLASCQRHFQEMELRLHRLIRQSALGMPPSETKNAETAQSQ